MLITAIVLIKVAREILTKGAGCFLLGVVLTASHYVFDLIAAPLGTIWRTIVGCKNLYSKTEPKGFFQHVWYIFKSLFLVIYNLIKLPFLVVYRATFALIEDIVGIIKPMCYVFRGGYIAKIVKFRETSRTNKFLTVEEYIRRDKKDPKKLSSCHRYENPVLLMFFATAIIEFESPLFNNLKKHGKFKIFFTGIWDTVHNKFGKFTEWLLLPNINANELITTLDNSSGNNDSGNNIENTIGTKSQDQRMHQKAMVRNLIYLTRSSTL